MKKYIVITSIFAPSAAVCKFAELNEYQLVVVGDLKSPKEWECENVIISWCGRTKSIRLSITRSTAI